MIIATSGTRQSSLLTKALFVAVLTWVALLAVAAAYLLQWLAVGLALAVLAIALTFWRPRLGFYLAIFLAVAFEPIDHEPIMRFGWLLQGDVSSWSPVKFINFSLLELLFLVVALSVLAHAVIKREGLPSMQIRGPLLAFLGLMVVSVAYGLSTGGDFKVSLWETRSLFLAGLVALLIPSLLPRREHVERLIMLVALAIVLLSVEIIWRRFTILADVKVLDLEFAHETPILMNFVVMLLIARLIWPASGRQRLAALFIPLILFAEMVTERRSGWIGLDVGFLLLAIFIFRLRRKLFFWLVLPLLIVYGGYLATFWNAEGAVGQPARAVRSVFSPDARDASSNVYRFIETGNIRMNIQAHPLTGLGLGHQFIFYSPLPDLSGGWSLYRYMTHNAFLWIWMKMGPAGFVAFLILTGAGVVRGVQLLKRATNDRSAPILVALVSGILMVLVHSYIDLAFANPRSMALFGLALGLIGAWGRLTAIEKVNE